MVHQIGQGTAVIDLRMIRYDIIDILGRNLLEQFFDITFGEGRPSSIDEGRFLIPNQVGIVGTAPMGGVFFSVKLTQFPVGFPCPGYDISNGKVHDAFCAVKFPYRSNDNISVNLTAHRLFLPDRYPKANPI